MVHMAGRKHSVTISGSRWRVNTERRATHACGRSGPSCATASRYSGWAPSTRRLTIGERVTVMSAYSSSANARVRSRRTACHTPQLARSGVTLCAATTATPSTASTASRIHTGAWRDEAQHARLVAPRDANLLTGDPHGHPTERAQMARERARACYPVLLCGAQDSTRLHPPTVAVRTKLAARAPLKRVVQCVPDSNNVLVRLTKLAGSSSAPPSASSA
ncbi:hypothetical protein SAMN04487769_1964 [Burkholderia sp. b14]|nr:hypothetical protein SAMN04487769_1964 [Burkholderia sp. b14]